VRLKETLGPCHNQDHQPHIMFVPVEICIGSADPIYQLSRNGFRVDRHNELNSSIASKTGLVVHAGSSNFHSFQRSEYCRYRERKDKGLLHIESSPTGNNVNPSHEAAMEISESPTFNSSKFLNRACIGLPDNV
jgi:hypothetical protein